MLLLLVFHQKAIANEQSRKQNIVSIEMYLLFRLKSFFGVTNASDSFTAIACERANNTITI